MSSSLRSDQITSPPAEPPAVDEPTATSPIGSDSRATRRSAPIWLSGSRWTLRAKLVASMLVLFAVVTLATGAVTTVVMRNYLYGQVDQQLQESLHRPGPVQGFSPGGRETYGRGPGNEGLAAVTTLDGSSQQGYAAGHDNERVALTAAQLNIIFKAGVGTQPMNLNLGGGLGTYRLMAGQGSATLTDGSTVAATIVVGLPTAPQDQTIQRMVLAVVSGVLAGLVIVFLAGTWLVRRNLNPLDRVAATATRVAHLPLSSGRVDLIERVPSADTDPRTEVGQVGSALNEMLDHIDDALTARHLSEERVRQFVADASHELRTPLASIRGYAELTRRETEPVPAAVSHAIGRVESEAMRMSTLVDDLLLLARLDAGRPLDCEDVDISEMVVNAVSDAHAAAPDHSWRLDLPDEPVEVRGDPARLHQIVANLLANARTHTAPGTVVLTSIGRESDHVRISVQDDGPGVPESLQPNVFQRFARGESSRYRAAGSSTGLGLSIVAAVAQAHGGTVELASRPGDTTFTVLLPA
ncbi:HAMP domain-containing sensor histidine kinase [Lapillicoccus sp.]|uniref:sensor histidine kinase n=1 Tax=Lapillicoccus sp. TaxID=1909287 RepID=UPI0032658B8B